MRRYRTTCLLFGSILLLGCASAYKDLQPTSGKEDCVKTLVPEFSAIWYRAQVDVYGKHISGLLLIKTMPDSSQRIVFTNEAGVTFFDFEFNKQKFTVHKVIDQLDKGPVIKTLRKDFELLLMKPVIKGVGKQFERENVLYHAFAQEKEINYFVTDKECAALLRIEQATKRKKKVELDFFFDDKNAVPDSVEVKHFLFNMQIHLKRLER